MTQIIKQFSENIGPGSQNSSSGPNRRNALMGRARKGPHPKRAHATQN